MNKKTVKITAIVIAIIFLLGLFGPLAYLYVFSAPNDYESRLNDATARLEAAEKLEQVMHEESGRRFRIMCEKGIGSYLDIVFASENLTDFTDRLVIANELMEYDKNMINAVSKVKEDIKKNEAELERLLEEQRKKEAARADEQE